MIIFQPGRGTLLFTGHLYDSEGENKYTSVYQKNFFSRPVLSAFLGATCRSLIQLYVSELHVHPGCI